MDIENWKRHTSLGLLTLWCLSKSDFWLFVPLSDNFFDNKRGQAVDRDEKRIPSMKTPSIRPRSNWNFREIWFRSFQTKNKIQRHIRKGEVEKNAFQKWLWGVMTKKFENHWPSWQQIMTQREVEGGGNAIFRRDALTLTECRSGGVSQPPPRVWHKLCWLKGQPFTLGRLNLVLVSSLMLFATRPPSPEAFLSCQHRDFLSLQSTSIGAGEECSYHWAVSQSQQV